MMMNIEMTVILGAALAVVALIIMGVAAVFEKITILYRYRVYTDKGVKVIRTKKRIANKTIATARLNCKVYKIVPLEKKVLTKAK